MSFKLIALVMRDEWKVMSQKLITLGLSLEFDYLCLNKGFKPLVAELVSESPALITFHSSLFYGSGIATEAASPSASGRERIDVELAGAINVALTHACVISGSSTRTQPLLTSRAIKLTGVPKLRLATGL